MRSHVRKAEYDERDGLIEIRDKYKNVPEEMFWKKYMTMLNEIVGLLMEEKEKQRSVEIEDKERQDADKIIYLYFLI